jgi:diguanylate cyclase (GGDEF)-like protein
MKLPRSDASGPGDEPRDIAPGPDIKDDTDHMLQTADTAPGVLLVEDEAIIALDLEESLLRNGYRLAGHATSGEEAITLAAERAPDIVIMDVDLPGRIDGVEAARQIRKRKPVPVVFLTGLSDSSTFKRAIETEPFGYLAKPFREVELRSAIEVAIRRHRAEMAMRQNGASWQRQSMLDELTGIGNRRAFYALSEEVLKIARRDHLSLALFFVDLDGLKDINDVYGHTAGDRALQAVAHVLSATFRESDVLSRIGGDEFLALARIAAPRDLKIVRGRVDDALADFNRTSSLPFRVSVSVGSVLVDAATANNMDAMIGAADAAMYEEKQKNRARRCDG